MLNNIYKQYFQSEKSQQEFIQNAQYFNSITLMDNE